MVTGLPFDGRGGRAQPRARRRGRGARLAGFRFALHAAPQPARERLALVAAALWCFYPATGVLMMPYTEALACVLVAMALLLLMRRRYAAGRRR